MKRVLPLLLLLAGCSKPQFEALDAKFLAKPPPAKAETFPAEKSTVALELAGHGDGRVHVAWSPDGKTLATAGYGDSGVATWDAASGRQIGIAKAGHRPSGIAWLDAGTLLTTDVYGYVTYWTVGPGGPTDPIAIQSPFKDHGGIQGMALSPNGTLLAAVAWGKGVLLWDVAARAPLRTFAPEGKYRAAAFSADGATLAVCGFGPSFTFVDLAARTMKERTIDKAEKTGEGSDVAFSGDGSLFCAGLNDSTFTIWKLDGMTELHNHFLAQASVWAVRFSPDGKTLATSQTGLGIYLWDPLSRSVQKCHEIKGTNCASLAFHPQGRALAAGLENGKVLLIR